MGVRGELFSTKMATEKRTYFFNVKENRLGDVFLTIVESKKGDEAEFERHQVMIYEEEIESFMHELKKAAAVVSKHKQVSKPAARRPSPGPRSGDASAAPRPKAASGDRPARPRKPGMERPEQVPTYGMDGKWEGPETMMPKGGKVARISRKDIEARNAKAAADRGEMPAKPAPEAT